jgi:hypothetical protein
MRSLAWKGLNVCIAVSSEGSLDGLDVIECRGHNDLCPVDALQAVLFLNLPNVLEKDHDRPYRAGDYARNGLSRFYPMVTRFLPDALLSYISRSARCIMDEGVSSSKAMVAPMEVVMLNLFPSDTR